MILLQDQHVQKAPLYLRMETHSATPTLIQMVWVKQALMPVQIIVLYMKDIVDMDMENNFCDAYVKCPLKKARAHTCIIQTHIMNIHKNKRIKK